jgi:hypothetical protein
MQVFAVTLLAFLLAFALLSLGAIFGRAALRWGCGGVAGADCAGCTRPCERDGRGADRP